MPAEARSFGNEKGSSHSDARFGLGLDRSRASERASGEKEGTLGAGLPTHQTRKPSPAGLQERRAGEEAGDVIKEEYKE